MHEKQPVVGEAALSCLASLNAFYKQIADMRDAEAIEHAHAVMRGAVEENDTGDYRVDRVGGDLQVLQRFLGRAIGEVDDEESCRIRNYIVRAVHMDLLPSLHAAHPERYLAARIHNPGPCVGVEFGVLCLKPLTIWKSATVLCLGRGPFPDVDLSKALRISSCVDDPDPETLHILADHQHPDLARLIVGTFASSIQLEFGQFVTESDKNAWKNLWDMQTTTQSDHAWHGRYKPGDKRTSTKKMSEFPTYDQLKKLEGNSTTTTLWRTPFSCMLRISKQNDNLSIVHPRYYAKLAQLALDMIGRIVENESLAKLSFPHAGVRAVANLLDHWRRCELEPALHRAHIMLHGGNAALATHPSMQNNKFDRGTYSDLESMLQTFKSEITEFDNLVLQICHTDAVADLKKLGDVTEVCARTMRNTLALGHRLAVRGHEAYVANVGTKEVPDQADFLSSKFMQLACRRQAALDVLVGENQRRPYTTSANDIKKTLLSVEIQGKTCSCLLTEHLDERYTLVGDSLEAAIATADHLRAYLHICANEETAGSLLRKLRTVAQEAYCDLLGVAVACPDEAYGKLTALLDTLAPYPIAVAVMRQTFGLATEQPVVYWYANHTKSVPTNTEQKLLQKKIVVDKTTFPAIVY